MPSTSSPKRVLIVENAIGFGGSTVCAGRIIDACLQGGFEPVLLISYDGRGLEEKLPPEAVWRLDRCRMFRWGRSLRRWLAKQGQSVPRVVHSAAFSAVWYLLEWPCAILLARRIRRASIDVVHANNDLLNNRIAIVAGHLARATVISHQRGWQWRGQFGRRLSGWVSRFVAISRAVAEDLAQTVPDAAKTVQIYDGVDCHAISQGLAQAKGSDRFGVPADKLVIGMPAMLVSWKGQDLFLCAFARLAGKTKDVYAVVVGDSPDGDQAYRESLKRLAFRLGIADRVVFAPFCKEPGAALSAMDVVVHASLRPEPLGLAVLEAMAAGKAVVAANSGGVQETVVADQTGLLYPAGDDEALADCLRRLVEDPTLRANLGHQASKRARATFDLRFSQRKIVDLYHHELAAAPVRFRRRSSCPSEPCYS
jgi:glycosyltransferase involved in cell wall biosynthesis